MHNEIEKALLRQRLQIVNYIYGLADDAERTQDSSGLGITKATAMMYRAIAGKINTFQDEKLEAPALSWGPGTNTGHGHVWRRPDGIRARCMGPGGCLVCSEDKVRLNNLSAT